MTTRVKRDIYHHALDILPTTQRESCHRLDTIGFADLRETSWHQEQTASGCLEVHEPEAVPDAAKLWGRPNRAYKMKSEAGTTKKSPPR
jgi:hypothetical protein